MRDLKNVPTSPEERLKQEIPLLGATDQEVKDLFPVSQREADRIKEVFGGLQTFCTFIGYPRSGHSIVGSLLDAHPEAIIAHELDVFKFVEAGFSASQIFYLLLENSRLCAMHGRIWGPYSYGVPGQWQGAYSALRVVGDNKGGRTTIRIAQNPKLLEQFLSVVRLAPRFIHVVRNPFDNVATLAVKQTRDLGKALDQYLVMCRTNQMIRQRLGPSQVLDFPHEEFVADPTGGLERLCRFLGLDIPQGYLEACTSIVYRLPHRSRFEVNWPVGLKERLSREKNQFEFLARYSFDE